MLASQLTGVKGAKNVVPETYNLQLMAVMGCPVAMHSFFSCCSLAITMHSMKTQMMGPGSMSTTPLQSCLELSGLAQNAGC